MKTVHMRKRETNTLTITIDPVKVSMGHKPHGSGAGKHSDKRLKRVRTRGASTRRVMREAM